MTGCEVTDLSLLTGTPRLLPSDAMLELQSQCCWRMTTPRILGNVVRNAVSRIWRLEIGTTFPTLQRGTGTWSIQVWQLRPLIMQKRKIGVNRMNLIEIKKTGKRDTETNNLINDPLLLVLNHILCVMDMSGSHNTWYCMQLQIIYQIGIFMEDKLLI